MQVSDLNELKKELSGSAEKTIYINGTIEFTGAVKFEKVENKTIYGLSGAVLANEEHSTTKSRSGILNFVNCNNIILRNLTFIGAGAYDMDGYDNLNLENCKNIWVDHCDFQDGVDGNFDCNTGSDNIAVTWCRFRYLKKPWPDGPGGSDDHRFSNLWGGSDSEDESIGHLNTTFYACWWDEGCRERMPRVRFGKVHMLNCLYKSDMLINTGYAIGIGYLASIYVERCAFIDVKNPYKDQTSNSKTDYFVTFKDCEGIDDITLQNGNGNEYVPSYTLEGMPVDQVETEVSKYAGATLNVKYGEGVTTGITNIGVSDADIVAKEYYSPSGTRLNGPQRGLNIVRYKMSDGTAKTSKIIVK